jgi:acyl carrier protein
MDEQGKQKVKKILADVLGLDMAAITDSFSYQDTDRWDSLKHMEIVTAVEQNFSVTLTADEIVTMTSFEDIARILTDKKAGG